MTYHLDKNTSSSSTTWVSKPDRMRRSRREGQQDGAQLPSFLSLGRRNARDSLTIQVRYRGGSEAWWLVEARGTRQAFPGHMCIHDVMTQVNGGRRVT